MRWLNIGYISSKERKTLLLEAFAAIFAIVLLLIFAFTTSNKTNLLTYRFNSGLRADLDSTSWKLSTDVTTGSVFDNNQLETSILFTSAKVEDTSKTLTDIVTDRVSVLNKQNIPATSEPLKINGIDFYKIQYKAEDNDSSISYATLYNGVYSTIQIFYTNDLGLSSAMQVINSIRTI